LHEYIIECRAVPLEWGVLDCGLFAAGAIRAMTGVAVDEPFLAEHYTDAASAAAAIQKVTGLGNTIEDAAQWIASQHALKELPSVLFAQRGDLVVFETAGGVAAGVVSLEGKYAVFLGEAGLRKVPTKTCKKAWRVG
jgi:hypothetical protein